MNNNKFDYIYVSLGMDCSIAYQLNKLNLRYFSLPFDWMFIKNINSLKCIFDDDFNGLINIDNYEICEQNNDRFDLFDGEYDDPVNDNMVNGDLMTCNKKAKFKLLNKKYNIIFPHELETNTNESINKFIEKIKRRIDRFKNLSRITKKIIFVRIGKKNEEPTFINIIGLVRNKYFYDLDIEYLFVNTLDYPFTTSWKRDEIDWNYLFTSIIQKN